MYQLFFVVETVQLTGVDPHVSVPRGPVVEGLAADGALLPLLRVAHASGRYLLHVVVQLKLLKENHCLIQIDVLT
jgi:hypothetical protein